MSGGCSQLAHLQLATCSNYVLNSERREISAAVLWPQIRPHPLVVMLLCMRITTIITSAWCPDLCYTAMRLMSKFTLSYLLDKCLMRTLYT
jgi:hypothetical protein